MKKVFLSFICFVLFLTSCSDFLNGSDLVNEINKTIEKANATVCDISIFSENNAFDFLGGKEKQIIKGEPVQFTCILDYENYKFNGFEPIATDNPSQRLDDYVKIDIVSSDEEKKNGTYKLEIRLLKEYPSIVIKLKSVLIPKVVSLEPEYDQLGVSCYRPIIFTFNQPMFREDLNDSFAKLTIVDSENNDFTKYYNNPVLSDDGKTLTVVPKYTEIEALVKENPYAEFVVKLSDDIYTANEDGSKSENKLKEAYTGKIRFINQKDTIQPEFRQLTLFNNKEKERIFTSKAASEWNETTGAEFLQNAVSNYVYINAIGSDKESGIKSLYVKETLVKYSDGSPANISVDGICEKAVFLEKQKNTFETATVPYELKTATDGLIKLDFYVTDYGNNNSPAITYYVVKYTKKSTKDNFEIYSRFVHTSPTGSYAKLTNICMAPEEGKISVYSEKDSEHTYYFDKLLCYDEVYRGVYSPMEIKVHYKEGSSAEWIELPNENIRLTDNHCYDLQNLPIPRKKQNLSTYVRFTAKNILNEEHILETQIPASDYIEKITITNNNTTRVDLSFKPSKSSNSNNYLIIITDSNNKLLANYKGNPPAFTPSEYSSGEYHLYTIPCFDCGPQFNINIGTASTCYKIRFDWNQSSPCSIINEPAPASITFPQVSLELLPPEINTGKRTVKVTTDYSNASENVRYKVLCYSNDDFFKVDERLDIRLRDFTYIQESGYCSFPETDATIIVKSGYPYNTKIVAYDLNGVKKDEKILLDVIDATYDNIPSEYFTFTLFAKSYNEIYLKSGSTVYLNEPDLRRNAENKVIVKKYIKKIESEADSVYQSSKTITKELLDKIPQADTEILLFDPVKTLQNDIPIRFDYLDYGLYSLILMKEDLNGNYNIYYQPIYHKFMKGLQIGKMSSSKIEFRNSRNVDGNSTISYLNSESSEFNTKNSDYNSGGWGVLPNFTIADEDKVKFIKISGYAEGYNSTYRYYNFYFYPNYYLNDLTLKRKMMFKYDNEYQILADQPALIQLVQSDIKLTTEPEDWDMRGQTIEYKQISDDFLYTVDLSKITKKYYAVLVHFADGSTKMISETK
ncbi:hypothetical protein [Treponema sp.]|uniref:hypothetical protein n=1 Tax=Treponema sp. TaxID=166 RepID=UPI00298DFD57|nr:hypothetical protein [Treponema sp.]MCQ2240202.1 hypothetical protein [Treponema sp.]